MSALLELAADRLFVGKHDERISHNFTTTNSINNITTFMVRLLKNKNQGEQVESALRLTHWGHGSSQLFVKNPAEVKLKT